MKPQSGLVLPVMLYVLFRRHLYRRPLAEAFEGLIAIAITGALALALWFLSAAPFGLGPVSLIRFYNESASIRPYTSLNAFNLWGVLGFWRNDSTGVDHLTIAGLSALHVGMLLFVLGTAAVLWRLHRTIEDGAEETAALMIASASVALLAFIVLTRMHERYLLLSLVVLAPPDRPPAAPGLHMSACRSSCS